MSASYPIIRKALKKMNDSMNTNESKPENANEECVGPNSANAGKAASCAGCPNASICASSGPNKPTPVQEITSLSSSTQHTILVLSGKGGVGKSTVSTQLAFTLSSRGYNVGLLDVDICGPSAPRMLGVLGRHVHKSGSGYSPVYVNPNLAVMSISFLLPDEDSAVVWRGPRKNGLIKQFLMETDWNTDEKMDYVIVDTPPGTSDEHISTVQMLQGGDGKLSGAIVVTTPEEVSMADVRKELNFCKKTKVPVLGIVENMCEFKVNIKDVSFYKQQQQQQQQQQQGQDQTHEQNGEYLDCTEYAMNLIQQKCPELLDLQIGTNVFPRSGAGPKGMAEKFNVPFLGSIPLDPNLLKACEEGRCFVDDYESEGSTAIGPINDLVDSLITLLPVDDDEDMNTDV